MEKLLKDLIHAHGVSGHEDEVRDIIIREIKPYVSSIQVDKMGNLICIRKGPKPRVMLAAHMDEIGLVVKSVDESGRIHFSTVGGIDILTLFGQRAHIGLGDDVIHGVISTEEMIDGNDILNMKNSDLFIDTGLDGKELAKKGVDIGTFIHLEQDSGSLGKENIIFGKALDDRLGCYILIEVAKRLKGKSCEVGFVFTVQEEIGLYGAVTSTYELNPDWAFAIDVVNTYESKELRLLGKGPCLTIKDSLMITNRNMNKWVIDMATKKGIPLQKDVSDLGTTDALSISVSKSGVPATVLGVAIKNIHSTAGIANLDDIENCIKLLVSLLENPIESEKKEKGGK